MQKTKKSRSNSSAKLHLLGGLAWFMVFFLTNHHTVLAATPDPFIQSYSSSVNLQEGMVVQLEKSGASSVIPASQDNIDSTYGVVVNMDNAAISVEDNSKTTQQVFVATSGHYDVLVSDQNGPISAGNYITVSPVEGIGMKDNSTEPIVVAQALTSFDGSSQLIGTDKVKTSLGTETVHLGLVEANISIGHNPLLGPTDNNVPRVIENLSKDVTGNDVTAWRIWLGIAILGGTIIVIGFMLYGAVRSSLISIGRNPLSKKAITKGFVEVFLTALIIFISAVFGVYLLLKV